MFRILFLDIDGVLNGVKGYSFIENDLCLLLNKAIAKFPDLKIVISSSWASYINEKYMTLDGFGIMLHACGLNTYKSGVIAYLDERVHRGPIERAKAIEEYANKHLIEKWVAIDDMELPIEEGNFVHIVGSLQERHVDELIEKLQ